jgi:cell division protein FtsL
VAAAAPLESPAPQRPQRAARPTARRRSRERGVVGGVIWIVLLAVLLAGIVALNVALLQLNLRLDRLGRERADLQATNAALSAQLSSAAAAPQVEALARRLLGLVPADQEETVYVELRTRPR